MANNDISKNDKDQNKKRYEQVEKLKAELAKEVKNEFKNVREKKK